MGRQTKINKKADNTFEIVETQSVDLDHLLTMKQQSQFRLEMLTKERLALDKREQELVAAIADIDELLKPEK